MSIRDRANKIKKYRCKNFIVVLESPKTIENVCSVIRNVNALNIEKLYVIDTYGILPENWQKMRDKKSLSKMSVSAIKWSFVKKFETTKQCLDHLSKKGFISFTTSPHVKGKINIELNDANFTFKKIAIWFGNESRGISDEAVNNSYACINLFMAGIVESFNLGSASGIVLYEAARQRREYQMVLDKHVNF